MQQWSGDQTRQMSVFDTSLDVGSGFGSALPATSNSSLLSLSDSRVSLFSGGDLPQHLHDVHLQGDASFSSRLNQTQAPGAQTVSSSYSQISPSLLRGDFYGSSFKDSSSGLAPNGNEFQPLTPGPLSHPTLDNHTNCSSLQNNAFQSQSQAHWQDVRGHGLCSSSVITPSSILPTDFLSPAHTHTHLTEANPLMRPESLPYGPPGIRGTLSEATELMQIKCNACGKDIKSGPFQVFGDVVFVHQQCCICSACPERMAVNDSAYLQNDRIKCPRCAGKPECLIASSNIQGHFMSPPLDANATSGQSITSLCSDLAHDDSVSQLLQSAKDAEAFASRASSPESPSSDASDLSDSANGEQHTADGSKNSESSKARGPRTQIKPNQLTILAETFNRNPKPSRHIQEKVAKETGLTKRVVQVWFQNKRSKEKRIRQMQRPQFSDLALYNLHIMAGNMLLPPHNGMPLYNHPGHVAVDEQRTEWQHPSTGAITPARYHSQENGITPSPSSTGHPRLVHPAATPGSAVVRSNRTPSSNWAQYKEEESPRQYPPVQSSPFTGNLHPM